MSICYHNKVRTTKTLLQVIKQLLRGRNCYFVVHDLRRVAYLMGYDVMTILPITASITNLRNYHIKKINFKKPLDSVLLTFISIYYASLLIDNTGKPSIFGSDPNSLIFIDNVVSEMLGVPYWEPEYPDDDIVVSKINNNEEEYRMLEI